MTSVILNGEASGIFAALADDLIAAGFVLAGTPPAAMLINLGADAHAAMATATAFAEAVPAGQEALIVNLLRAAAPNDWPAASAAATLWAFTRHMALAWAPRRIRVNALGLGSSPVLPGQAAEEAGRAAGAAPAQAATPGDVAATILAFWRLPSMTGQLIRLAA
jgi:NAD(P)-dependent dehydrogenase (short-subunit alcohol dehydrogenase family)